MLRVWRVDLQLSVVWVFVLKGALWSDELQFVTNWMVHVEMKSSVLCFLARMLLLKCFLVLGHWHWNNCSLLF